MLIFIWELGLQFEDTTRVSLPDELAYPVHKITSSPYLGACLPDG